MKMVAVPRHGAGYLEVSISTRLIEGPVRHPLGPHRLPQPLAAKERFRFYPVAISTPFMFTFRMPLSLNRLRPCQPLRLSEYRLDSDPAFTHGLLERSGALLVPDSLEQIGMEGTIDDPALSVRRALRPERASLADRGAGTIPLPVVLRVPFKTVARGLIPERHE